MWGGGCSKMKQWIRIRLVFLQFSSKFLNSFLVKSDTNRQFLRLLATFLGMIIIAIGATENGHSISEFWWKMADVFLNSAIFWQHVLSTLAPPSSYTMNLKTLTKVSKVSWTSKVSYEILYYSFEWKFRKDKLHFSQKTPPKSPHRLGLKASNIQVQFTTLFPSKKQLLKAFVKARSEWSQILCQECSCFYKS